MLERFIKDEKLVKREFERRYKDYNFPFEKSDRNIAKMNEAERRRYYNDAKEVGNNTAFAGEMKEIIRSYYEKLAIKALDGKEVFAYRLTLIALQELQRRLEGLGAMYVEPKLQDNLEKIKR